MKLNVPSMQDLLTAGVHFGHQVRRGHPKMNQYIYGARDGVHIIDLAKSEEKLKEAVEFVYNLGKEGKVLLLVGTKKQAKEIVESLAKEVDAPYISERWVGGLLTNFDEIRRNLKRLGDLKNEKEAGTLTRYTKKEQLLIDRELEKFERVFGGVAKMDKVPDAMFVVDAVSDKTAVKEAFNKGLTLVGFADTNSDPNMLDFPIPANDDGIKSIKIICETVIKAYGEGKKSADAKAMADKEAVDKEKNAQVVDGENKLDKAVAEEAEVLEEVVEKKAVEESERKV
ncbi:30S ribosomal protein S2 [Candidatus Daviesbacteria bacterium]|nr:30S ribosomal protein S2 [Candidatus Daviesbacteria bacterium]